MDSIEYLMNTKDPIKLVLMDPPWGDVGYKKKGSYMLYMGKSPLYDVANNVINRHPNMAALILKVPRNFDHVTFGRRFEGRWYIHHLWKTFDLFVNKVRTPQGKMMIDYIYIACVPPGKNRICPSQEELFAEAKILEEAESMDAYTVKYSQYKGNPPIDRPTAPVSTRAYEAEQAEKAAKKGGWW